MFGLDLSKRSEKPELMDNRNCDKEKLIRTVRQFKVINPLFSASQRLIKKYFLKDLKPGNEVPYTFVDLGAGGCDIALWVSSWCRKKSIKIEIICIENDPNIVPFARRQIALRPEIELWTVSALDLPPGRTYDFIFSNHFLHHLPDPVLCELLVLLDKTGFGFLMNDLKRSFWSFLGYKIFAGLFLHRSFANYDGGLSILRGFLREDLGKVIEQTGLSPRVKIRECSPGRIYLLKKTV